MVPAKHSVCDCHRGEKVQRGAEVNGSSGQGCHGDSVHLDDVLGREGKAMLHHARVRPPATRGRHGEVHIRERDAEERQPVQGGGRLVGDDPGHPLVATTASTRSRYCSIAARSFQSEARAYTPCDTRCSMPRTTARACWRRES